LKSAVRSSPNVSRQAEQLLGHHVGDDDEEE
jgi:hypothetical protein